MLELDAVSMEAPLLIRLTNKAAGACVFVRNAGLNEVDRGCGIELYLVTLSRDRANVMTL